MNGNTSLIFLIVGIGIAALGAILITEVIQNAQSGVDQPREQTTLSITNVIAQNITADGTKHVRISVQTGGVINLNDTSITLRSDNTSAYLRYRNGTLERNITEGFFTQ